MKPVAPVTKYDMQPPLLLPGRSIHPARRAYT